MIKTLRKKFIAASMLLLTVVLFVMIAADYASETYWSIAEPLKIVMIPAIGIAMILCVSLFLSRFVTRPAEDMLRRERQFISDASHELKTPVTAIRLNAQVLASQAEDSRYLRNILSETERMDHLVRDLLTFSYLEEKGERMTMAPVSLTEECEEVALTMESVAFEKGIEFSYEIEQNISCQGDSDALKRVLTSLLDNAISHTPQQGRIGMTLCRQGKHPVISITNTGEMIPPEDLPHIFERFYRAGGERIGSSGRFGLGLSIAKAIVEGHGGTITAKNLPDGEVEFEVRL